MNVSHANVTRKFSLCTSEQNLVCTIKLWTMWQLYRLLQKWTIVANKNANVAVT